MKLPPRREKDGRRIALDVNEAYTAFFRWTWRNGQTILSGLILGTGAVLFVMGCGAGKDSVSRIPTPTTTTTTTTGGIPVDFNAFPTKLLFTDRGSRGAIEIRLSVSPNRPLSVIPFQSAQQGASPELHFDAEARYTGFGLGGRFAGEYVPYLRMSLAVTNRATQGTSQIDLVPTISLRDGLHYARNLRLPGDAAAYDVALTVRGPEQLTEAGGSEGAVAYASDLTPSGVSGTPIQPGFIATYRTELVPAQLVPQPSTTTTTATTTGGTATTGVRPPTTGGYGQ